MMGVDSAVRHWRFLGGATGPRVDISTTVDPRVPPGSRQGGAVQIPKHTNYVWTYDLYGPVCNVFNRGKSITRAIGRVGP